MENKKEKPAIDKRVTCCNVSGLCVVALSRNLKLTTTLDRAITQNPCYVPLKVQHSKVFIYVVKF
jgi:hypothetical protein